MGSAFANCSKLKSIVLPASLTTIGDYAFSGTALTSIIIPASVESLGSRAFGSCANLVDIRIEDSDLALQMSVGYYGTFAYSDADKTVYFGREL